MSLAMDLKKLRERYDRLQASRVQLQTVSAAAQRLSKQSIFSMQRDDEALAQKLLQQAEFGLRDGAKIVARESRLLNDGTWRSALEEFTEAAFFYRAAQGGDLFPPHDLTDDPDILLGGLSDMVGELVRLAVHAATRGDVREVDRIEEISERVVGFLLSVDATGSTRQKVDQARQHLRRLEDVRYDLSRRA